MSFCRTFSKSSCVIELNSYLRRIRLLFRCIWGRVVAIPPWSPQRYTIGLLYPTCSDFTLINPRNKSGGAHTHRMGEPRPEVPAPSLHYLRTVARASSDGEVEAGRSYVVFLLFYVRSGETTRPFFGDWPRGIGRTYTRKKRLYFNIMLYYK